MGWDLTLNKKQGMLGGDELPASISMLPDYGHHVASCLKLLSPCSPHLEGLYHGPKSILCSLSSFCYSKEKGLVPTFNEVTKGLIGIC